MSQAQPPMGDERHPGDEPHYTHQTDMIFNKHWIAAIVGIAATAFHYQPKDWKRAQLESLDKGWAQIESLWEGPSPFDPTSAVAQVVNQDAAPARATHNAPTVSKDDGAGLDFGPPTRARAGTPTILLRNPYFASGYNDLLGTPDWVTWRLVYSDIGNVDRGDFYADPALPRTANAVSPSDYTGSGFDRGHLCNHQDRSRTQSASRATFAMTNIIPQAPNLNQKTWLGLESYCRKLASRGWIVYIAAGGHGTGGTGSKGTRNSLGNRRPINVPAYCWKVVLLVDRSNQFNANSKMFGVIMPNVQNASLDWTSYLASVSQIEQMTGLSFFPRLPAPAAQRVKQNPQYK